MFHFKRAFTRMFTVSGRAGRSEYHFTILLFFIFTFIGLFAFEHRVFIIIVLASVIMMHTALIRRIHDLGYAAKLFSFGYGLPLNMWWNMSMSFSKGEPRKNKWGLPPEWEEKGITSEEQARFLGIL